MTPDEARQSITALYRATRDMTGGTWEIDGHNWLDCPSSTGTEEAAFSLSASRFHQALPGQPKDVVTRIQELWAARGIPAQIHFDKNISLYLLSYPRLGAGAGQDGYLVRLSVSDGIIDFDGTSRCVPGDSLKLGLSEVGRAVE